MSEFSERRVKLAFTLSLFTAALASVWCVLAYSLQLPDLGNYIGATVVFFIISATVAKKGNLTLARVIYMLALNISVALTASYVGKAGSVEFVLMFALALPFIMFSFRREKHFICIFSGLSALFWLLLYLTDFTLFTDTPMDQVTAGQVMYPFSIASTVILVTFQLVYFSFLNARFYSEIHDKREEAIEASNAKSRFLSTMSHEIRTPLNAVIGLSHILDDNNPRPDQKENIEALNYSGKILLNLLNNVLDFSKMESQAIQLDSIPTDISEAVKQIKKVHEPNCLRKGITMQVQIDKELPTVWLDIVRFNQVVNNLISNAIKFTDEGGVTLKITKQAETENSVHLLTEIHDTGIGISAEQQEKIWEAFTQASVSTNRLYGGTGLGLPIVKRIVQAMGGDVHIKSESGKGSCFYFEVELELASAHELDETAPKAKRNLKGKKVLLVEDNQINVMVGKQILEKTNLAVDVAYDGQQAVDMVQADAYDAVLMDIQMPVMDGYTATTEIRKFNTTLPILGLSASVFMEVKDKIFHSGMNGFIFKPFEPEDLLNQVEDAVNGKLKMQ
jgi:signal transduction histidine kinase/BarA-like signal transduction histidine kinase